MDDLDDYHFDDAGEAIYSHERGRTISSLQQDDSYRGATDLDSYADALLTELGVSESALHDMASSLAAAKTRKKRPGFVDAAKLAKNWKIGLEAAKRTVNSTTQSAVRGFFRHSRGGRRLKPEHWQKRQKRLNCMVFCDNFIGRCTSL